jgi:hypothetical protein
VSGICIVSWSFSTSSANAAVVLVVAWGFFDILEAGGDCVQTRGQGKFRPFFRSSLRIIFC